METASAGGGTDSPLDNFSVADGDASALLSKLISLGYLCSDGDGDSNRSDRRQASPLLPLGEPDEYTLETTRQAKECLAKRRKEKYFSPSDASDCRVVLLQGGAAASGGCITRDQLVRDVATSLESTKFHGRASLSALAEHQGVDAGAAEIAVSSGMYLRVQDEVISTNHLDVLLKKISEMLVQNDGHAPIAALASDVCNLPLDVCLNSVLSKERLLQLSILLGNDTTVRIANLNSLDRSGTATRRELVTSAYDYERAKRMKEKLESAQEPVPLGPIIRDLMWDDGEALGCIVKLCRNADGNETLDGAVKGVGEGSQTADSATYVPNSYLQKQRRSVEEYFRSNGYVTVLFITSLGVTIGDSKVSFVRECCGQNDLDDDIVELPNSVINAKDIISPLEGLIEEANSLRSFLDFSSVLPETLLSDEDDIRKLLEEIVPARLSEDVGFSKGTVVICDGALYLSWGMTKDMESNVLMPLIETYGKERAKEIDEARAAASKKKKRLSGAEEENEIITTGAKLKKKSKKSNRREDDDNLPSVDDSPGILPLEDAVASLIKEYPALAEIQENGVPHLADDEILWDDDGTGLVFELCRKVFGPSKVAKKCARAVKLELDKIESMKQGISLGGRRAGALKAASIEESFEASFADECYLVQILAKLPQLLEGSDAADDESVAKLQRDFLLGCASNFARRLTMFALYKHQVDEGIFTFDPRITSGTSANSSDLPDVAVRAFPRTLLSCTPKDDGSSREPLATLREVLPGSVGVELARLWKCLPGEVTDDPYVRPGSMDDFFKQAEESCLIICGLPYKKINKKAEKKIMFERRKQLTALLEASSDPIEILQNTIILLYQQIKSIAVAGDELFGAVLDMLCCEKKINDAVKQTLFEMRDQVVQQGQVDDELMNAVRACGLSRDITSHES